MPLLPISGSLTISGSISIYSGSINAGSGSIFYLPYLTGSYSTGSVNTGSLGIPFLYVVNQVLWYYDGSTWNQLYP